ncbi:hypothetical protein T310_8170, partial [Rasamsonia emersonii CBS 393.64]
AVAMGTAADKSHTSGATEDTEWEKQGGRPQEERDEARRDLSARAQRNSAPRTRDTEKIGGGARILKYERLRRARPSPAASPVARTRPDHPGSGQLAAADWWPPAALCRVRCLIGRTHPKAESLNPSSYPKSLRSKIDRARERGTEGTTRAGLVCYSARCSGPQPPTLLFFSCFSFAFLLVLPFFSPENYDPTCLPSQRAGQCHTLGDSHPGLDPDKPVATEERSREIGGDGGKKKGGWDLVH